MGIMEFIKQYGCKTPILIIKHHTKECKTGDDFLKVLAEDLESALEDLIKNYMPKRVKDKVLTKYYLVKSYDSVITQNESKVFANLSSAKQYAKNQLLLGYKDTVIYPISKIEYERFTRRWK